MRARTVSGPIAQTHTYCMSIITHTMTCIERAAFAYQAADPQLIASASTLQPINQSTNQSINQPINHTKHATYQCWVCATLL
jgi:hypothetical protein